MTYCLEHSTHCLSLSRLSQVSLSSLSLICRREPKILLSSFLFSAEHLAPTSRCPPLVLPEPLTRQHFPSDLSVLKIITKWPSREQYCFNHNKTKYISLGSDCMISKLRELKILDRSESLIWAQKMKIVSFSQTWTVQMNERSFVFSELLSEPKIDRDLSN